MGIMEETLVQKDFFLLFKRILLSAFQFDIPENEIFFNVIQFE
jgi:hypothetical protein